MLGCFWRLRFFLLRFDMARRPGFPAPDRPRFGDRTLTGFRPRAVRRRLPDSPQPSRLPEWPRSARRARPPAAHTPTPRRHHGLAECRPVSGTPRTSAHREGISRVAPMLCITGISISIVTTSGRSAPASSTAAWPSAASATTLKSSSLSRSPRRFWRSPASHRRSVHGSCPSPSPSTGIRPVRANY